MLPTTRFLSGALALAALTACGGGGSDNATPPPAAVVITATADTATLAWNRPATVKVLANDTASRGALTVSAVSTPTNGTARIVGSDVEYTPKADHTGTDTFTYTARAEDGTTATATVTLQINAAVTLKGVVTDGPIANAVVTAQVGTQTFTATADAQGAYSLAVQTATPADTVLLSASGVGAQAHVKLTAVLGDVASASRGADVNGVLGGTGITHYSTALAALVTEANGNQAPATAAKLAELSRGVAADRLVELATAIKLVVDKGVALPSGVADTAALVNKPGSSAALTSFLAQQAANNAAALGATRTEVLAGDGVTGQAFAPTATTERLFYGTKLGVNSGMQLLVQPDGSGRLASPGSTATGKWTFDAAKGDIVFTLDTPRSVTSYTADLDPVSKTQNQIRYDTDLYRFKQIAGDTRSGAALVQVRTTSEILDGSRKGQTATLWSNDSLAFTTQALTTAFKTGDFSVGMKFAGIAPLADINVPFGSMSSGADILELTGATTARLLRSGEQLNWKVAEDGAFVITQGDLERRLYDLGLPDSFGLAKWVVVKSLRAGAVVSVDVLPAAPVDGSSFSAGLFGKRWASQHGRTAIPGGGTGLDYSFAQNGTGQRISVNLASGAETVQNLTWTADWATGNALISVLGSGGAVSGIREWMQINSDATGNCFSVLEQVRSAAGSATGPWRLNVLTQGSCTAGGAPTTPAALGTLVSAHGEKFALRVKLTLDAQGQITGGDYDFHTTKGTLTPCTATPDNTGATGTCIGASAAISTSSQSGAIPRTGTPTAISLNVGPDAWGYSFTGTLLGKVWTGTFTKVPTTASAYTDSGSFAVEVSIP